MPCPHCASIKTDQRPDYTVLGYRPCRCRECRRTFNERTGTVFNRLQYPTDVVCLVALWRHRYKLSLRGLAEMFLQRGLTFTHEAARDWECKLAPWLSGTLRKRRYGTVGASWYADETYVRVDGRWQYLYRAIDRDGNEDIAHGLGTDGVAEVFQSANHTLIAPGAVFLSHAHDQSLQLGINGGTAKGLSLLGAITLLGNQCAVPGQNRRRFDNRGDLFGCLLAELYTDLGEGCPLTVTEPDTTSDLGAENTVFRDQVVVAQWDLLGY